MRIEAVNDRFPSRRRENRGDRFGTGLVGTLARNTDEYETGTGDTDVAAFGRSPLDRTQNRNASELRHPHDFVHFVRAVRFRRPQSQQSPRRHDGRVARETLVRMLWLRRKKMALHAMAR